MSADTVNEKYIGQQSTKKFLVDEIEGYLDKSKQSIDVNNNLHPTGTLATTLLKPAGEENLYV